MSVFDVRRCRLCGDEVDQCSDGRVRHDVAGVCVLCELEPPVIPTPDDEPHHSIDPIAQLAGAA